MMAHYDFRSVRTLLLKSWNIYPSSHPANCLLRLLLYLCLSSLLYFCLLLLFHISLFDGIRSQVQLCPLRRLPGACCRCSCRSLPCSLPRIIYVLVRDSSPRRPCRQRFLFLVRLSSPNTPPSHLSSPTFLTLHPDVHYTTVSCGLIWRVLAMVFMLSPNYLPLKV